MLRTNYGIAFCAALLGALAFGLSSCGGKGNSGGSGGPSGPPFIAAEVDSFPSGAVPPGLTNNAFVAVLDSNGNSIGNATVTINAVTLNYVADDGDYEGSIFVAPGSGVALSVAVAGQTYTASATQFTSYPTVSVPASGATWDSGVQNTVTWSGGAPTANAGYVLGILDAADPNGLLQWPASRFLQEVALPTTSFSIPAVSIPAGGRHLIVGISANTPIANADAGSVLIVQGFNYVPITVTGLPITVRSSGTNSVLGVTNELADVAWTGSQFVAVGGIPGGSLATNVGAILTSPDGITWTSRNSGTSSSLDGVAASATQIVAVGQNTTVGGNATIVTSTDGVSWTPRASGVKGGLSGVTWSGTQFVAVGSDPLVSGTILTSLDGISWTPHASGTSNTLESVAWSGTLFAAVGSGGIILTSPDGNTWTAQTSGTSTTLNSVTWSGTQFVAVGSFFSDVILTSPDGVTWTSRSSGTTAFPSAVAWSGSEFVAVGWVSGVGATIITSPDGITWTRQAPGTFNALTGVVWSGTQFVIVGGIDTVLTSP